MKSTQPAGGVYTHGVPRSEINCVSVPPTSGPRASPVLITWSDRGASSPIGDAVVSARRNDARS